MMVGKTLRGLISANAPIRAVGVHDGLSAIMAENAGFEALWAGGLGISTSHGVPDAGILTMTEFLQDAVRIRRASSLPVIADVDAGFGDVNVVRRMVGLYEAEGIDAVCIEDKQYPKRNSFLDGHLLEEPLTFARKIEAAKAAQRGESFMVVARLESLIAGAGMEDALSRAVLYAKAGADAILVHSKERRPDEIAEFCARAGDAGLELPLFAVPTTYHATTVESLHVMGIAVMIYANQLIRGSVTAMEEVLTSLARTSSTTEMEDQIVPVKRLFDLVGTERLDNAGIPVR
ncbi:isocitrate lyase/phosphoenolpyruvate mutase family protein [Kitasatospora sp. NPDC058048]|uniref:isocitrate lyase/phosphoenolpyruvate mutase family protein n=1 Tax=Kitasatospora sp. NPDC058048 TaxID=3346313 RepID=UPI0036DBB4AE